MISKIRIVGHLGRWAGLAAFMIVLACATASCSKSSDTGTTTPGTEPTPAATTPETTPATTPATSEATPKPEATPEATPAAPQAENLIKNPDLAQWANGMPVDWDKEPWDGVKVTTTTETHDGKPVVQVAASGDIAILKQAAINAADLKPGDVIHASAWVKAEEPGKVALALARLYVSDGKESRDYEMVKHPGDGAWKKLEATWQVPATVDPNLTKVVLQVRADLVPAKPFLVSETSLTKTPGVPPPPVTVTPKPEGEAAAPAPAEHATPAPAQESAAPKAEAEVTTKPEAEKKAAPAKKSKKRKAKTS